MRRVQDAVLNGQLMNLSTVTQPSELLVTNEGRPSCSGRGRDADAIEWPRRSTSSPRPRRRSAPADDRNPSGCYRPRSAAGRREPEAPCRGYSWHLRNLATVCNKKKKKRYRKMRHSSVINNSIISALETGS